MKHFTDVCQSDIGLMAVKLSARHKKSLIWGFQCWSCVCSSWFLWFVSIDFVLQTSLSPSPSVLTTLKTSVEKEFWVSVIHCRNFSACRGDRWDTNTDSINKINPSAPINCISACLLSLGLFSPVQPDGNLSRQCYIGLIVYLLADKFVKPHETLSSYIRK